MRYRKKPVEIEAWPVAMLLAAAIGNWENLPPQVEAAYNKGDILFLNHALEVVTLEGRMTANRDDYLICGTEGELYPCKPAAFAATFDLVEAA